MQKEQKGENTIEEQQIDKMVYKLYLLTDEEIKIGKKWFAFSKFDIAVIDILERLKK